MPSQVTTLFGFSVDGVSGIYCAIHRASSMCYVGSSTNIRKRFNEHLSNARRVTTRATLFHRALREFGIYSFDFSVLEECDQIVLLERERFYIALFNAASVTGFNTRPNPTATYDARPSAATGARISAAKKGMTFTPEQRSRQSAGMIGTKRSIETKDRMSAAATGKIFSPSHRSNIGAARKGCSPSAATRAKVSASLRGRLFSEESKRKMSETSKANRALLGVRYADHRKAIVATDHHGVVLHVFESLLDAVAGLETPNSSLRYYLRTGGQTPLGMFLHYATIVRP